MAPFWHDAAEESGPMASGAAAVALAQWRRNRNVAHGRLDLGIRTSTGERVLRDTAVCRKEE